MTDIYCENTDCENEILGQCCVDELNHSMTGLCLSYSPKHPAAQVKNSEKAFFVAPVQGGAEKPTMAEDKQ